MSSYLTKSGYVTADECERKMWFNQKDQIPPKPKDRYRMLQGQEVGQKARDRFDGGHFVSGQTNEERAENTQAAIERGEDLLFEATFLHNRCLVQTDVLRKDGEGWEIIEVKATSSFNRREDEILADVAFQYYVLRESGVDVESCTVMHLNGDCTYPNLENLFTTRDVTEEVQERVGDIRARSEDLQPLLKDEEPPEMELMRACKRCRYRDRCWGDELPEYSIFSFPYVSYTHTDQYLEAGHRSIEDVREGGTAHAVHDRYLDAADAGGVLVDEDAVQDRLASLEYPLHFFDFETINPPIPQYPGTTPWQQVPFQYSLHLVDEPGAEPRHGAYLHDETSDPREPLIQHMIDHVEDAGSIVVYSSFEERQLQNLADAFPTYRDSLEEFIERLWDQEKFFSEREYLDVDFQGRSSIKVVLPVLVPSLSYDHLDVQDGTAAQRAFEKMIGLPDGDRRRDIRDQLLEYCKLDTRAMLEIHRTLWEDYGPE